MRLSTAIARGYRKAGAKVREAFFHWSGNKLDGACAVGCAYLGTLSRPDYGTLSRFVNFYSTFPDLAGVEVDLAEDDWRAINLAHEERQKRLIGRRVLLRDALFYLNDSTDLSIPEIVARVKGWGY